MHYIYCYENKINSKVYIGQTVNIAKRDRTHTNRPDESMPIDRAIQKYGRENFDYWCFEITDTNLQADQAETYWIVQMRHYLGKENVYNVLNGGGARSGIDNPMFGKTHTKETRQFLSKINKGRPSPNKGKKTSEHTKKLISEKNKGKPAPNKGKKSSDEAKQKLSTTRIERGVAVGEKNPAAKLNQEIVKEIRSKYTLGGYLYKDLADEYKISKSLVGAIIRNETWKV